MMTVVLKGFFSAFYGRLAAKPQFSRPVVGLRGQPDS